MKATESSYDIAIVGSKMMRPVKSAHSESVKVVVRCRPMSEMEISEGYERVIEMWPDRGVIELHRKSHGGEPAKQFTFDAVYDWNSKQQELYDETFRPLVDSVLNGFNGTIFAYGQTGTGKTYTMEGVRSDPERKGVIPNSFDHIFNHIARSKNQQYLLRASYLEIYQEEIRDLMAKDQTLRLDLKERPDTGVYVKDLSSFVCKSPKEIENVMSVGNQNRSVGATNMNEHSSRSHAIFIITVECSEQGGDGENHIRVGKLNLVDLAGSERQNKTGSIGARLKEATKINLSLSALGNVISALVDGKNTHIPYRDSKLTRLLQDSLGGNAKTIMVANIGPASYNYDETLTTLRYANRAKNIKNKPRINEDPKDALLREFQQEIAKLKATLAQKSLKRKKKHKSRNEIEGTDDSQSVEDEDEVDEEDSTEELMKEQESKLEEEKNSILTDQHMIAEQKERLMQEMKSKEEQLIKEKEAQEQLDSRIKSMESKLLSGGKNIVDHTNEQQRALEQRRQEIADQKRKEREMAQQLEEREESTLEIRETFSSLQQEVELKTKKLRRLFSKLQQVKHEINDISEDYSADRRDLEQTQNSLMKELKLKYLVIENFIPPEEKQKILSRLKYDEDDDQWKILPLSAPSQQSITKRPVSASGYRRPVSEYARMAATMGGSLRYKGENIMRFDLDMPTQTTRDYESPVINSRVQAVLHDALNDMEADIDIDARFAALTSNAKVKGTRKEKTRPKNHKSQPRSDVNYPQPRGLVPK